MSVQIILLKNIFDALEQILATLKSMEEGFDSGRYN